MNLWKKLKRWNAKLETKRQFRMVQEIDPSVTFKDFKSGKWAKQQRKDMYLIAKSLSPKRKKKKH